MLLLNYPSKGPNFGRDSHFSNGGSGSNEHKTGPGPGQARRPTKTHCRISPRAREVPFGVASEMPTVWPECPNISLRAILIT